MFITNRIYSSANSLSPAVARWEGMCRRRHANRSGQPELPVNEQPRSLTEINGGGVNLYYSII
jgi:hypothetical protein